MVTGIVTGVAAHWIWGDAQGLKAFVDNVTLPAGNLLLRLIMMVVIPLVMSALILDVAELGDPRRLGRVGLRTLMFTILLSSISVVIGVGAANLVRPGEGLSEESRAALMEVIRSSSASLPPIPETKTGLQIVLDLIPENPVEAMTRAFQGDMIAVMVFALTLGIALTTLDRRTADPFLRWLQALFEAVMKVIDFAMRLAPFGVGALLFTLTARFGAGILKPLAVYVLTVLGALLLHQVVTYSLAVRIFGGMSPTFFFTRLKEVMLTAFSTSSSNATLPTTLRVAETELGVPRSIGHFVLTLGSTLNQNGTALYEGITVIFLAQFFGVPLTLGGQVTVALLSILAGVGTAGVPGGSLPLVTALLVTVGVPAEGILIILGVDRLLDMCRTVLNVTGDVAVAVCVARSEAAAPGPAAS